MTFVDSPVKVYNFQVEQLHTYFVSELGVWVHNADKQYKIPKSAFNQLKKYGDRAFTDPK